MRIGRTPADGDKKKPRPIKAELSTFLDCDHLLPAAKKLKTDHAMANITVARWIPREEMEKVKLLRSRCETLNSTEMPSADGRKPYLVISGQIMKRTMTENFLYIRIKLLT